MIGRRFRATLRGLGTLRRRRIYFAAELKSGVSPVRGHVIFFAKNLEKARHGCGADAFVEPITTDSGGNHFFRSQDLDGNKIECGIEPDRRTM